MEGRELLAEYAGSLFLATAIIASGILGMKFTQGNVGLSVFINAIASGFVLFALIEALAPVSECHINPAVTISAMISKGMSVTKGAAYIVVQIFGGITAVALAHSMFEMPLFTISEVARPGYGIALGEFVATFGLLMIIFCCVRGGAKLTSLAIGLYVTSTIYWTSSTCFANPQVTIGRIFTNTLTGIRPVDGGVFLVIEIIAAIAAMGFYLYVYPKKS